VPVNAVELPLPATADPSDPAAEAKLSHAVAPGIAVLLASRTHTLPVTVWALPSAPAPAIGLGVNVYEPAK
jgi:hypothetical protein